MAKRAGPLGWVVACAVLVAWLLPDTPDQSPASTGSVSRPAPARQSTTPAAALAPIAPPSKLPLAPPENVALIPPKPSAVTPPVTLPTETLLTTGRARVSDGPSTSSRVLLTLNRAERVTVIRREAGWFLVDVRGRQGWVAAGLLKTVTPAPLAPPEARAPNPPKVVGVQRPRPRQQRSRSGEPIREPTFGQGCDCPYDVDRAGRTCGRRSAYSKPGGRSPQCYF